MTEPASGHTVKSFDSELKKLDETVGEMAVLARDQIDHVIQAVIDRNVSAAVAAESFRSRIDKLDVDLNERAVKVLALRQPMADDLRTVVTALKVSGMLERVGDYGAGAARRACSLADGPVVPVTGTLNRMGQLVIAMLDDATEAFLKRDALLAKSVWARDEEVDAVHSGLFRELLTYMLEDPRLISACSHLLFVAKTIERVGDQATNISESAYYRTTGRPMEGARPKGDVAAMIMAEAQKDQN